MSDITRGVQKIKQYAAHDFNAKTAASLHSARVAAAVLKPSRTSDDVIGLQTLVQLRVDFQPCHNLQRRSTVLHGAECFHALEHHSGQSRPST